MGIDAGGTRIRVAIGRPDSPERQSVYEVPSADDGGPGPLREAIAAAFSAYGKSPFEPGTRYAVCAGITKITRSGIRERWEQELRANFHDATVSLVPDYVIAFHGAVPTGVGVCVIAGTGSVVYGENAIGEAVRVGGRGWEYGDEGSGAHITTELIRRTLRALDGLDEATPLTRAVVAALGTDEPSAFGEAARRTAETYGRGFLVPLVLQNAEGGDRQAKDLFVGSAGWLAAFVRAAATRLRLTNEAELPVATVGGLWQAETLLTEPFETVLRRWIPGAVVRNPQGPPVLGAVRLANRMVSRI
ncbi:MAG TPA: BadF/BadG/BcrA/BcrD ATPase family protein [Armatimonadaceae bacterium]|nr:BadF/BadG/BcrA/BcrD ATPase family protein [Armatimonadaceae bacterium]